LNSKKGISPLIATVLIIGFTIVLAVLVITWISGTVDDTTTNTDCMADANNKCLAVVGDLTATATRTSAGVHTLTLTNNGGEDIDSLQVVWYQASGASGHPSTGTIAGYNNDVVGFTNATTAFTTVKVFPIMSSTIGDGCQAECSPLEKDVTLI